MTVFFKIYWLLKTLIQFFWSKNHIIILNIFFTFNYKSWNKLNISVCNIDQSKSDNLCVYENAFYIRNTNANSKYPMFIQINHPPDLKVLISCRFNSNLKKILTKKCLLNKSIWFRLFPMWVKNKKQKNIVKEKTTKKIISRLDLCWMHTKWDQILLLYIFKRDHII